MFQMLKTIYILYNCIYHNINNNDYIDKLIDNIDRSGCLFIKIIQWILPRIEGSTSINNNIKNKLSKYYDKCNIHSLEYTNKIYKKEFGDDILSDYDIIDILGSGSMGQVYKIKEKKTGKFCAMKVLHPDIKYQYYIFYILFNIIFFFIDIKNYIYIKDIGNIFIDLKKQTSLINESNNMLQLKSINCDKIFLIPDIIKFSDNVLIMSYIESEDKKNLTEYKQESILIKLILLILSNSYYGISHADLHNGNWGIHKDKIVLYDFGYCNSYKEDYILGEKLLLHEDRLEAFHFYLKHYFNLNNFSNKKQNELINMYDKEIKSNFNNIYISIDKSLKHLLKFCHENKILISCKSLNALIDSSNLQSFEMGSIVGSDETSHLFKEQIIDLCTTYNCYEEYKNHLIKEYNYEKKYKMNDLSKYDFLKSKII